MGLKVMITGGSGQVGSELVKSLLGNDRIEDVSAPSSEELSLSSRESVFDSVGLMRPDWIIHIGAWTQVDACEDNPEKAFLVNGLGTRFVVQAAEQVGSRVCYLSTDYVFDGTSRRPYREWDQVGPRTVYGASKLAGEMETRPSDLIVRTSWVMGVFGQNMAKTLIRLARAGGTHRFVKDQIGTPTIVSDLVSSLTELFLEGHSGIFHISNSGQTSWYEVARFVFEKLGEDPERILPISTSELSGYKAPRPMYSVLDNCALRGSGLDDLPAWQDSLAGLIAKLAGAD
ncbi:MAG: dTDP-4-dehydrorhamnose reductase [Acidimicrobiaceae bacterium]|nr:dTDP-4-dehydrorhamnose reductase [Acidimicrobiaceae bacterium]